MAGVVDKCIVGSRDCSKGGPECLIVHRSAIISNFWAMPANDAVVVSVSAKSRRCDTKT